MSYEEEIEFNKEAIIRAVKAVIEQGEGSLDEAGRTCRYRHGSKRCLIGWMIDDSAYDEEIEGFNCNYSDGGKKPIDAMRESGLRVDESLCIFADLQSCHDISALDVYRERLSGIELSFVDLFISRIIRVVSKNPELNFLNEVIEELVL